MTDERQLAVGFLVAELACAASVNSQVGLTLVASSLIALLVGYLRKSILSAAAAGLLLYYPLAVSLGSVLPGGWNFIASSIILIPLAERLGFEYRMSKSLKTPLGVDEETKALATRLAGAHGTRLLWYVLASTVLSLLSLFASAFISYFPLLAAASVLLIFALWMYTRR